MSADDIAELRLPSGAVLRGQPGQDVWQVAFAHAGDELLHYRCPLYGEQHSGNFDDVTIRGGAIFGVTWTDPEHFTGSCRACERRWTRDGDTWKLDHQIFGPPDRIGQWWPGYAAGEPS